MQMSKCAECNRNHEAEYQRLDAHMQMLAKDEGVISAPANWLSAIFPFMQ